MRRFFVSSDKIREDCITIAGGDAFHISRSLRMGVGGRVIVCDMRRNEYVCAIKAFPASAGGGEVELEIIETRKNDTEPCYRAYLYQALPKGDKMDYIVQKAVELGVCAVIPFISERCVSRPDKTAAENKRLRWQRIAEEASKQCGRGIVPEIFPCVSFGEAVGEACANAAPGSAFMCYEGDGTVELGKILGACGGDIRFLIGPEGGFSFAETELSVSKGLLLAGLGKRILRCETASGFVLSCLSYSKELQPDL